MLMEELSPSFTRLERELIGWFASELWGGLVIYMFLSLWQYEIQSELLQTT